MACTTVRAAARAWQQQNGSQSARNAANRRWAGAIRTIQL
jgi:hypothetical protein